MKFLTQAAKALQEKKKYQHRLAIFLCLAVVVTLGTFAALKLRGQAMTHQRKVLKCQVEIHQHSEECYDEEDKEKLICGMADYVVHKHNDDCYNLDTGELVCPIEELEVHKHDDSCYQEEKVLICGKEETAAHTHTPECYTRERGELQCTIEEHTHTESCYTRENTGLQCPLEEHQHNESCYDETGALTCQKEEHQHNDDCYAWTETLNCSLEEHQHNDDCYTWIETLTCQQEESETGHTHTDDCYEVKKTLTCGKEEVELHTHDENCYDENGVLTCKKLQVEEHVHGEECFETVELSDEEVAALNEAEQKDEEEEPADDDSASDNSTSKNATSGNSASENSASENAASDNSTSDNETGHVHDESCYDSAGGLMCGFEDEASEPDITKVYETDDYVVTAVYKAEANIPEEAELIAELITADKDEEHYAKREAEIKEALKDENVSMNALFKIGFYVDDKEIEPEGDVNITIQFLDENGLAEGSPIAVIHFSDGGNQVISGGKAKNKSTTFKTKSFSEFGIVEGYEVPEETEEAETEDEDTKAEEDEDANLIRIPVSKSYEYETDAYHMTFRLEGEAILSGNELPKISGNEPVISENENKPADEEESETETEDSTDEEEIAGTEAEDSTGEEEAAGTDNEELATEEEAVGADGGEASNVETFVSTEDTDTEGQIISKEDITEQDLEFHVQTLAEDSEEYITFADYTKNINHKTKKFSLDTMRYSLSCGTENADLSECKVTLTVSPADGIWEDGSKKDNESTEIVISTLEIQEDGTVKELGNMLVPKKDNEEEKTNIEEDSNEKAEVIVVLKSAVFAMARGRDSDPNFTVQYYANLDVLSTTGTNALPVINTKKNGTQEQLPKNKKGTANSPNDNEIKNIYVDQNGKMQTTSTLTKVYEDRSFNYKKAPSFNYINVLVDNPNYTPVAVWILKEGKNATSINKNDWTIYPYSKKLHFTNSSEGLGDPKEDGTYEFKGEAYIVIKENAVMRLVYNVTDGKPDIQAAFYDYDITSGHMYTNVSNAQSNSSEGVTQTGSQKNDTLYYSYTKEAGINSAGNYSGSGTKLSFGNVNTGTTMGENLWDGNLLNKYNGTQSGHPSVTGSYKGCTFELVTGMQNGKIQYASNVSAPKLFNDEEDGENVTGKTSYDNNEYSLKFNRTGDTYTLTAVNGTGATGLESFGHPSPNSSTTHTHIWTNDFWPMDSAPSYGTNGHDLKFGSYAYRGNRAYAGSDTEGEPGSKTGDKKTYPYSDDGKDHNSYFGMHYQVEFELVADYVGPLEYYFFGDDDMWVFLGDKLICDIGGVHSSVGEYVDLWDYIDKETEKIHRHTEPYLDANGELHLGCYNADGEVTCGYVDKKSFTLSFFYTERGASGSTCWMQFTLPSVSSKTPETTDKDYGDLRIEKTVTEVNNNVPATVWNDDIFKFNIELFGSNGEHLLDDYSYIKYNKNGVTEGSDLILRDGSDFELKGGEYIIIKYLPTNAKYLITETNRAATIIDNIRQDSEIDYATDITEDTPQSEKKDLWDNKTASGNILSSNTSQVNYNNKYYVYSLPETGGPGMKLYTMAGALCIMFGAGFLYKRRFRERRG